MRLGERALGISTLWTWRQRPRGETSCLWGHIGCWQKQDKSQVCRHLAQSCAPCTRPGRWRVLGAESKDGFSAQGPGKKGNSFLI